MSLRTDSIAAALSVVSFFVATTCNLQVTAAQESVTMTYGPFLVPAATESGPGNLHPHQESVEMPCIDGFITRIVPDMVYADGSSANFHSKSMMHHVVFYNSQADDLTCPGGGRERFFATDNERSAMDLPEGFGYYNSPAAEWDLSAHLMNFDTEPQELFIQLVCTCEPYDTSIKSAIPVWLDVDNCGDSEFSAPAGYSDTQWDWQSSITGTIVRMGGHVHNFGTSISAEHLDTGGYICTAIAGYESGSMFAPASVPDGDEGHPGSANLLDGATNPTNNPQYMGRIQDMTLCEPFFTIAAGDTIRLHTQYNIPSSLFPNGQDDVMGIMIAYVHEQSLFEAEIDRIVRDFDLAVELAIAVGGQTGLAIFGDAFDAMIMDFSDAFSALIEELQGTEYDPEFHAMVQALVDDAIDQIIQITDDFMQTL